MSKLSGSLGLLSAAISIPDERVSDALIMTWKLTIWHLQYSYDRHFSVPYSIALVSFVLLPTETRSKLYARLPVL